MKCIKGDWECNGCLDCQDGFDETEPIRHKKERSYIKKTKHKTYRCSICGKQIPYKHGIIDKDEKIICNECNSKFNEQY